MSPITSGTPKQNAYATDVRQACWECLVAYARECGFGIASREDVPVFLDLVEEKASPMTLVRIRKLVELLDNEMSHRRWINAATALKGEASTAGSRMRLFLAEFGILQG